MYLFVSKFYEVIPENDDLKRQSRHLFLFKKKGVYIMFYQDIFYASNTCSQKLTNSILNAEIIPGLKSRTDID